MFHLTTHIMKKTTKIFALFAIVIFMMTGCKTVIEIPFVESNTPLGCDRQNDRYYDFIETEECLRPTTYEQLYILDKFRFFSQYAKDHPEEVIKIRVGFNTSLDATTYEQMIVAEEKIIDLTKIDLYYPLLDERGLGVSYSPAYSQDSFETITRNDMLQAAHEYAVSIFSGLYYNVAEKTDPLYNREDMETYSIDIVEVTMKASEIPTWWQDNKTNVRYIQPLITDIDPVQTPYRPGIQIVPRGKDPEIDWDNQ